MGCGYGGGKDEELVLHIIPIPLQQGLEAVGQTQQVIPWLGQIITNQQCHHPH